MIRNPFDTSIFNFNWAQNASPGAGNNLTLPLVVNARVELVCMSFNFNADANAADRYLTVSVVHGARIIKLGMSGYKITANMVRIIMVGQHGTTSEIDNGNNQMIAIPSFPFLLENDTITVNIADKQAGDVISATYWATKTWVFEQ